jgi:hypothetical protein
MAKIQIPEIIVPDKRLGRSQNHDPRSRAYGFVAGAPTITTTMHQRMVPVFNQGGVLSCTGNAVVGALGTQPLFGVLPVSHAALDEAEALAIYAAATAIDPFPGTYPPTDTGSDGLSVAKVALAQQLISGYQHTFTLMDALAAIMLYPVITGFGWYSDFDVPDANGLVKIGGYVRGGHEVEIVGVDAEAKIITLVNSWGTLWGKNGFFSISWDDFGRLLNEGGDVTVLLPLSVPAPTPTPLPPPSPLPIVAYTLTYVAGAYGSITGAPSQTVMAGAYSALMTAIPNAGAHFVKWSDGNLGFMRVEANVKADATYTAIFALDNPVPAKPAAPTKPVVAVAQVQPGKHNAQVLIVQKALNTQHFNNSTSGTFDRVTVSAYSAWQKSLGYKGTAADGRPGLKTLTALGAKCGFTVKA